MRLLLILAIALSSLPSFACDDDALKMVIKACKNHPYGSETSCANRALEVMLQHKSSAEMVLHMCNPGTNEGQWELDGCLYDAIKESTDQTFKNIATDCNDQSKSIIPRTRAKNRDKCVDRRLRNVVAQRNLLFNSKGAANSSARAN
jgi:hypothetical protein